MVLVVDRKTLLVKNINRNGDSLLKIILEQQTPIPPHFVGIKSNKLLIVDQYDFTVNWDLVYMTAKDYKIESSMNGETWNTLYSGIIPSTNLYTQKCEFEPTICKYIRFVALSTYDQRGYKWLQGRNFKIYGTLAGLFLYTNPDAAYGIRKKEG